MKCKSMVNTASAPVGQIRFTHMAKQPAYCNYLSRQIFLLFYYVEILSSLFPKKKINYHKWLAYNREIARN
jgi:hypothetical protein